LRRTVIFDAHSQLSWSKLIALPRIRVWIVSWTSRARWRCCSQPTLSSEHNPPSHDKITQPLGPKRDRNIAWVCQKWPDKSLKCHLYNVWCVFNIKNSQTEVSFGISACAKTHVLSRPQIVGAIQKNIFPLLWGANGWQDADGWSRYSESPKVVTPMALVSSMRRAGLSQLPGESLRLFHQFEMRKSVKLIHSALDICPASFFASGDQIPLGRENMAILRIQQTSWLVRLLLFSRVLVLWESSGTFPWNHKGEYSSYSHSQVVVSWSPELERRPS
jgi:hypothetical protein